MEEREMTCPVCGYTYYDEGDIEYIEGNGMCYHCFCEFDDELREGY